MLFADFGRRAFARLFQISPFLEERAVLPFEFELMFHFGVMLCPIDVAARSVLHAV